VVEKQLDKLVYVHFLRIWAGRFVYFSLVKCFHLCRAVRTSVSLGEITILVGSTKFCVDELLMK